ncbi:MAG TPA: hypothetical protein DCG36_12415 [Alteromonas macleodii]|uniref:phage tail protein n=1 Tax=uncultured Thalassolituus sp. TaxID=285273 RepID=UPI000E861D2D|nr:hypothetical protein [Alteromonas macleodii]HBF72129.1 hypothetical protein [Alteromonas australica]|tara:strand:- start:7547 stop:11053 length:3507 start_codon:yes stop_codon:yes gene_type:complete
MPAVAVGVALGLGASAVGATVTVLGVGLSAGLSAIAIGIGGAAATHYLGDALSPDLGDYASDPVTDQSLNTNANDVRKIVYGEALVGGKIVGYAKPTIGGDDYHIIVLHLVGHPCESVDIYEIEGKTKSELTGLVTSRIYLGDQTTVCSLANQYISGWTSEHVGINQTYVTLKIKVDDDAFPSGLNEIKFIVRGHKVYDPRKDTTQGGDGQHRFDDETTWEWSSNPALCTYDCLRRYGAKPVPLRRLPIDFIAVTANYCDEPAIYRDADGNEQTGTRFEVNGVLNNGMRQSDMLNQIMACMGGKPYRIGGVVYFKPAMYAGPATIVVDVDNSSMTFPEYRPHRPYKEKVNTVKTEYVSPALKWQMTNAPVVKSDEYRQDDGAYLESSLRLTLVTRDHQAQRIGKLVMERSRAGFIVTHILPGVRLDIMPGSCIKFVDVETGVSKEFTVEDRDFDTEKHQTKLQLIEDGPQIYPDSFEAAEGDLTPNTALPDATVVQAPENLQWTTTPNDSWRQGVLTWDHPSPSNVINYIVSVSNKDDQTPVTQLTFTPANRAQSLAHLPIGVYTVAVSARNRFRSSPGIERDISIGVPSTPTQGVVVNVLPGRVVINGPTPPHNNATYEWKYSYDGDEPEHFDSAIYMGKGDTLTITNTPHDGVIYVWYRIIDVDQIDPNWLGFSIADLIGTVIESIDPEIISRIQWPGLPAALGDHLNSISNDLAHWSEQSGDLGENYHQLIYNLTEAVSANQINSTEIIGLKQKVGTKTVSAQFAEFTQVNIGYEDENGEWVVGAPLVRAFDEVKVVNKDGDELSVINFMQALENKVGELEGTYYLGVVDDNENFTGLSIQGGDGDSDILLYMDNLRFASQAGQVFFALNTVTGQLEINANTVFTGTLSAARKIDIGTNFMTVSYINGFGPDNLCYWKGEILLDGDGNPDYAQLSKSNGVAWADLGGNEFNGGDLTISGILQASALRRGSGVMISDDDKTAPLLVMSMTNSRSTLRTNRSLTSNVFVGPSYERTEGESYDNWRLVNYKSDFWLRVAATKHSGSNKPITTTIKVKYSMEDETHSAHDVWETISTTEIDYSYDFGTIYLPFIYTSRDEPWNTLTINAVVSSTETAGKPLSASLEIQAFNNLESSRSAHSITGDSLDADDTQPPTGGVYHPKPDPYEP